MTEISNARCRGCEPKRCWNVECCEALKPELMRAIRENYRLDCIKGKQKKATIFTNLD
jgi:hypothetical protein